MATSIKVLGIMNGTSLDGVDFVLCTLARDGRHVQIRYNDQAHSSFPSGLRHELVLAARHELNVSQTALVHHELGRFYAREVLRHKSLNNWRIQLAGVHGQTVFHQPPRATLQIGEPSYLAQALGVPVVNDFRVADLAAGGQAAPLAPLFHQVAFQKQAARQPIAIHNLGGISNVTYLHRKSLLGFDTGPANMLIDLAAQKFSLGKKRFDDRGKWSASGLPHPDVIKKWMSHPYFRKKPPKSCGREEFGETFLLEALKDFVQFGVIKPEDQMSTLSEFTAESIAHSYRHYLPALPKTMIVCGGGVRNTHLMSRLQYLLPECTVTTTEAFGWPASAVEGAAFALLAAYRYWEIPVDTRKITGAKTPVILGKISLA